MRGVSMGHDVAPNSHEGAMKALGRGAGGGRGASPRGALAVGPRFVGRRFAVRWASVRRVFCQLRRSKYSWNAVL